MEKVSSSSAGLARTISDKLLETVTAAYKCPPPIPPSEEAAASGSSKAEGGSGGTLSRKSSRRLMTAASPGRSSVAGGSGGSKNAHIRKSRSAQMKVDPEDLSSGAALSRASSASLGLSFSFTGFTMPPEEITDLKPFSDDDGDIRKLRFPFLFIFW